jgi:hypothetical protein
MANSQSNGAGMYRLNTEGWPAERWAAIVVLGALGVLILLRMGFRGVNVMGASVSVG